jgi:hypothetical protein
MATECDINRRFSHLSAHSITVCASSFAAFQGQQVSLNTSSLAGDRAKLRDSGFAFRDCGNVQEISVLGTYRANRYVQGLLSYGCFYFGASSPEGAELALLDVRKKLPPGVTPISAPLNSLPWPLGLTSFLVMG